MSMDNFSNACTHPDIRKFDGVRCCLACGTALFERQDTNHLHNAPLENSDPLPYTYRRLNYQLGQEVRVITLFPGRGSEDIFCDIVHLNLLDKPHYEALSYTWANQKGDSSLSKEIFCQGRSIAVTENCHAALRNLRHPSKNMVLWVDAICIDQQHISERNHQVNLMSSIYSQASQVLVYIGESSPSIDRIMDNLKGPGRTRGRNSDWEEFLETRWFRRAWVLQEVALAKSVELIAGCKRIAWTPQIIRRVAALCNDLKLPVPGVLQWEPESHKASDWLRVLHKSRNCEAGDPRDKVYAVRSLVSEVLVGKTCASMRRILGEYAPHHASSIKHGTEFVYLC
ncbi:HET-domain-containing protein [Amniculicola lignicola CBS 123094]|uniref:HET-domain-containing protein n=1 Tax=Amniculicola lignicola CBS 123094 TaxID=1392246 RepID=A0A6A5X180_9PLEO|nr:HET-domain-containing protein [Amniculicola lignicola CBS 123094]